MNTQLVDASKIFLAVEFLKKGEPVVFPTETVYGIGAPVFDSKAIEKIFSIKNRPSDNPLIAHVSSIEQALLLIDSPPPSFFVLARHFWPGPLTIILKRNDSVPSIVSAGQSTIGVRMPSHPIALDLILALGSPLVAPSANLSGNPSPTCVTDALEDLGGKVALMIDGGPCSIGIESTVLSLVHSKPTLLRPGHITKEELESVLQESIELPSFCSENSPISPGMKYRHYAPKASLRLVYRREDIKGNCVLSRIPREGERLLSQQTLFSEFRRADRRGDSLIEIYCDSIIEADMGLMNRLVRAAEGKESRCV